jgi:hypothetical protein
MLSEQAPNLFALGELIRENKHSGQPSLGLQPVERRVNTRDEWVPVLHRSIQTRDAGFRRRRAGT